MVLLLEVVEGPSVGQRFKLNSGMRLGRTTGEIIINDPKISSLHAQIERDPQGRLVMVDQNSSNGLMIDGIHLHRVVLMPGVVIQIGRTFVKILRSETLEQAESTPRADWRAELSSQIIKITGENSASKALSLGLFEPALKLVFLEGPQADQEQIWGYGPRRAGSDVLDLDLEDELAPATAFEVHPDENGAARFETQFPNIVRLNNLEQNSDLLKDGDLIRIGKTLIRIDFIV